MQVEIIESPERVLEIGLAWDELYAADPYAQVYLSSRYLTDIALRTAGKFRILCAWTSDQRCVGLLPLIQTTQWNKASNRLHNVLDMLGHVFDADYTGILCAPEHEAAVCQTFAETVLTLPFGRIELSFFDGPQSRLDAFTRAFDPETFEIRHREKTLNAGETNNLVCPYVALPDDFESYLRTLSANSRQKLRRLQRQLETDPSLHVTRSRPETYKQDVTILSELWLLQYAERKGRKRAAKLAQQFRETVMIGLAAGMMHLAMLWRDNSPVAAQAHYLDPVKRQVLFHVGARDDTVRDLAIGLMLQTQCIRWAIANGFSRYDFTLGDEPYKYSFGAVDREIASIEIATKTGENTTARLDERSRTDVAELIRRYVARNKAEQARIAAAQAVEVWPDLDIAREVESRLAQPGSA